jgi:hypothetical protein
MQIPGGGPRQSIHSYQTTIMKSHAKHAKDALPVNQPQGQTHRHVTLIRRTIIPIAALLSGMVAFAVSGLRNDASKNATVGITRHATATAPDRSTKLRPTKAKLHQWQWPTDGKCTYQIKQTVDLAAGDSNTAPEACGTTEIEGKLNVCFLDVDDGRITLAMQLSDSTVTVDPAGEKAPARQPVIENMLNSSAGLLHLDRDGRVLSCDLPAALADEDRAMLQGLFATEFVLVEGTRWEAEEKIQGPPCRSFYRTESGASISKTRQALETPQGQPSLRILKSGFTAVPGPFWIESLDGAEQIEYVWQDRIICAANTSVKLARLEETTIPESLIALMNDPTKRDALIDSASLVSSDESTQKSARERQNMARLVEQYQAIPAAQMIDDLVRIVASGMDHESTIPAMYGLRDWLLANPVRSSEIAEALKKPELQGAVAARMTHALELAGQKSKESQTALASIIAAPPGTFHPSVQMQAAVAAGGVGRVQSSELMSALSDMASAQNPSTDYQLSDAAFYAMGSLARDNPAYQQSLLDAITPMLDSGGKFTSEDAASALRTFANARNQDPVVLGKARALLSASEDVNVHKAAIELLALSDRPEDLQAIRTALVKDSSENVSPKATDIQISPEMISP